MHYPHPYLTVCLLDGCNKACRHCYRTAIPSDRGFKLTKRAAMLSLDDAASLKSACMFAGGEPTIWQDEDMDFLSLLMEAAKRHGRVAFISNGHVFEERDYALRFVRRYAEECSLPVMMVFSVDFIHENYAAREERIPFLDNLLAARTACAAGESIVFSLVSHWTNDEERNIPLHVLEDYAKQGVRFGIDDFMAWGRGAEIDDLACYLQVGSIDKAGLGAYRDILVRKMIAAGKIGGEAEFDSLSNADLLQKASVCGHPPNFFISWGEEYFYCIPQMGHGWFSIGEIGRLGLDAMELFYRDRPVIKEMQSLSILGVLDKYKELVDETVLEELESIRESIRFAGCSACLKLCEEGILQEINQTILNES